MIHAIGHPDVVTKSDTAHPVVELKLQRNTRDFHLIVCEVTNSAVHNVTLHRTTHTYTSHSGIDLFRGGTTAGLGILNI